jgi:hypothetical protein
VPVKLLQQDQLAASLNPSRNFNLLDLAVGEHGASRGLLEGEQRDIKVKYAHSRNHK